MSKQSIWFSVHARGVGGAERRMTKVMDAVAERYPDTRLCLVINQIFYEYLQKDREMKSVADRRGVVFFVQRDTTHLQMWLYDKALKYLHLKDRLKFLPVWPGLYLLRQASWHKQFQKLVQDGDVVHCFSGVPNVIGSFFFAEKTKKHVLMEITGPCVAHNQMLMTKHIFRQTSYWPNLHIRFVSKNVERESFLALSQSFLDQRKIDFDTYDGPFVEQRGERVLAGKKNIMVFPHRVLERKNPILFARVIKKLFADGTLDGWRVKFRGHGPLEGELKAMLCDELESGRVDIGFSNNLGDELAESKIAVGLIRTGNYPSQSLFEAIRHGNLLFLSRTEDREKIFHDTLVQFTELDEECVVRRLRETIKLAEAPGFEKYSEAMVRLFDKIQKESGYLKNIYDVYHQAIGDAE